MAHRHYKREPLMSLRRGRSCASIVALSSMWGFWLRRRATRCPPWPESLFSSRVSYDQDTVLCALGYWDADSDRYLPNDGRVLDHHRREPQCGADHRRHISANTARILTCVAALDAIAHDT